MSVKTYRRLWCDTRCGTWHGLAEMPGDTADHLRRSARADGWHRTRDGRDLCPDCWTARRTANAQPCDVVGPITHKTIEYTKEKES